MNERPDIPSAAPPASAARAEQTNGLERLAVVQQLTLEAGLAATSEEMRFRLLNRTILLAPYDRALLWDLSGARPRLLGVSGDDTVNERAETPEQYRRLLGSASWPDEARILSEKDFQDPADDWSALDKAVDGLSVAWVPIPVQGTPRAALWLERWSGAGWTEEEIRALGSLGLAYGIAWRAHHRPSRVRAWLRKRGGRAALAAVFIILILLFAVRVPLRVVAPCEVVADDPVAVTAPQDGIIAEIRVTPGASVEQDEVLAVYDRQVALEEQKVALQQVQIIESDLRRIRVQAVDDPGERAAIRLLENRLAQEQTRLKLATIRVERLEIRAPIAGEVMLADPNDWRGRPVRVGERMMRILRPGHTRVRIWLPQGDNLEFDRDRPVTVTLRADHHAARSASLQFVNRYGEIGPDGISSFRAEATWTAEPADVRVGLRGSAILYGETVTLGYWLFRKPIAAFRVWSGV